MGSGEESLWIVIILFFFMFLFVLWLGLQEFMVFLEIKFKIFVRLYFLWRVGFIMERLLYNFSQFI